jgi:hypothetical protein
MTALAQTEYDLLDLWGRGAHHRTVERGLLLLATARPHDPLEVLIDWPVGRRDAAILDLRERIFGPEIEVLTACPACGERFESICQVADLITPSPADGAGDGPLPVLDSVVPVGTRRYRVRPPTSRDLLAAAREGRNNLEATRRLLVERCAELLDGVTEDEDEQLLDPDVLAQAAEGAIRAADPQAGLTLESTCPACAAGVVVSWDIVAFVWRELHAWALHTLQEIHRLATAYGWTEHDVLQVPASRRRIYLELAGR